MTDWSAGTYDGVERARELAIAAATPAQRLAWLEDALLLAHASGALARDRAQRQQECDALWAATAQASSAADT